MNDEHKDLSTIERLTFAATVSIVGSVLIFVLIVVGILRLTKFVLGVDKDRARDSD